MRRDLLPSSVPIDGNRGAILISGLSLFSTVGYHAASIRDIAKEARLVSASLYSHFTSKEAILAELVLIGHEELHRRLLGALVEAGVDARDQLSNMVRAHVASHLEFPMLAVVANHELQHLSDEAAAPALALRRSASTTLVEVLERGRVQGVFDLGHPVATIAAISTLGFSFARFYPERLGEDEREELAAGSAVVALRMVGVMGWAQSS